MFLATTALREFWDPAEETVFLGSWCLTGAHNRVMSCPWDDRERFYRAASYVDSCSEALLHELCNYLNGVHKTSHSERYWRIILGPWLSLYSSIIYDRLVCLQSAFERYSQLETIVMHESSFRTPADLDETNDLVAADPYNLQIFSQLLKLMNFSFKSKTYDGPFGSSRMTDSLRDRALSFAEKLMRLPFQARATFAVRKTNLSPLENWKLAWATRFRTLPLDFGLVRRLDRPRVVFNEARLGLAKIRHNDSFERILAALLPTHFPTLYLEGYRAAEARVQKLRRTPVLVSGSAWSGDEEMKFYAAHIMEKGSRLVSVQHGGGYGVWRSAPYETHERRLSDRFLTWGDVVNPRFSERRKPGNTVLFIATGQPRYLYRFHSSPVGSQWDGYFDWQHRFLTRLPDELRSRVCFRPYPIDYGHAGALRVRHSFPSLAWDDSPGSIYDKLAAARIVVIDHLVTSLLETLAANIPTILFWDPNRWEARPEAAGDFDRLRQAQILWDSPETAAEKLIQVYEAPGGWWNADEVQSVRREFVSRYALTKENWISSWVDNLSRGLNGLNG